MLTHLYRLSIFKIDFNTRFYKKNVLNASLFESKLMDSIFFNMMRQTNVDVLGILRSLISGDCLFDFVISEVNPFEINLPLRFHNVQEVLQCF